ncbi:MAG: NAD+ diphosphatase [Gammaproteobacteria bacterium]
MSHIDNIYYRNLVLDRKSELRKDPDWINTQWNHNDCEILLVQNGLNLMHWQDRDASEPVAIRYPGPTVKNLVDQQAAIFLGLENDKPVFAAEIQADHASVEATIHQHHQFIDLREAGWLLPANDAAMLALGRGIIFWNDQNRFCGRCGEVLVQRYGGHMRECINDGCSKLHFPRTDPAVIMLIEDRSDPTNPRCLLARNSRFPNRMMSTLAGFVDPLESLEETVIREAFEETGVIVDEVTYQTSQPWPFPSSIMLGFRASAVSTEIHVDGDEIEEAHWFTIDELTDFGEWGDDSDQFCLPRKDSIARYLVESWKQECLNA